MRTPTSTLSKILLRIALAAALILPATAAAEPDGSPVDALRDRQARLRDLDFAVQEAELIQRLCTLQPTNPECVPAFHGLGAAATSAPAPTGTGLSPRAYQVEEISGSNGRLHAILTGPDGVRHFVETGSELVDGVTVQKIGVTAVTLSQGERQFTLRPAR